MSTNGQHAPPESGHNRRTLLVIAAIVLALLVFGVGYAIGQGNGGTESASPSLTPSPTATHTRSPKPSPSERETPSETESPSESADPNPTAEPLGDTLPDGHYFVRLNDLQGGENGPPTVTYDLAYFLTGADADKAAKDRGLETPVPDGYFIVNDSHRTRFVPLADSFGVRYIPEGNCCNPVKAHNAQFLGWLGETTQSDFPPKETSWWWITIAGGEVTKVEQQFLP